MKTRPFQVAESKVLAKHHRFVDWYEFVKSGETENHLLYRSTLPGAWDACHHIHLWDWADNPYPIMSLGRPYLDAITAFQDRGPEVPHRNEFMFERRSPQYFGGVRTGDMAVVDLVSAYHQLYKVASLDLQYDGEHEPRNGHLRFLATEELKEHRQLRHHISGLWKVERVFIADHGVITVQQASGKYQRPDLWGYLQDMLEAVAWDMRTRFGAFYVFVDGYIFPHSDLAQDAVEWLATEWSLDASIRARGTGVVRGLNHWTIGETVVPKNDEPETIVHEEGFPYPVLGHLGEHVDNMVEWEGRPDLRGWYVDARAYFDETPMVACAGLDGQEVEW